MRVKCNCQPRSSSPVGSVDNSNDNDAAPIAPLRRPRSPVRNGNQAHANSHMATPRGRAPQQATHYPNNNKTRFVPPGHHVPLRTPRAVEQPQNDDDGLGADRRNAQRSPRGLNNNIGNPSPQQDRMLRAATADIDLPTVVPSMYLVEVLPIGSSFVLSVEQKTNVCASQQAGYVCLAMHKEYEDQFKSLLGEIFHGNRAIVPKLGETFAYYDPDDESWYRARCLSPTTCALLDSCRVAQITPRTECRELAATFTTIPEFCCVLNAKAEVNMSLICTLLNETCQGFKVSIASATGNLFLGEGYISRWKPEVNFHLTFGAVIENRLNEQKSQLALEEANSLTQPTTNNAQNPSNSVTQRTTNNAQNSSNSVTQPTTNNAQNSSNSVTQLTTNNAQNSSNSVTQPTTNNAQNSSNSVTQPTTDNAQNPSNSLTKPTTDNAQKPSIPEVSRPDVVNNGKYLLLHVTSLQRVCVRANDDETTAEFESVLQDAALYGMQSAKPLTTPPTPGQEVLCQYEGVHFRALVTRTKATENRYKVQYTEYGNEEVVPLEKLFSSPVSLSLKSRAARATFVSLSHTDWPLSSPANDYIDTIKEQAELLLTIPTGEKTAPSGSLVTLTIAKNKLNLNKKLEEMCTPEWKKLEEAGGDVLESDVVLFSSMNTQPLPTNRQFTLEVTDFTCLERGVVSGHEQGIALRDLVFGPLTDKINEYCNSSLCSDAYLPMVEEMCLAKMDPYPQWFRAVVVSHRPGAPTATVLYVDYGNLTDNVPVSDLRKCMPEFAKDPALAATAEIKGWPKQLSQSQLARAVQHLQVDESGGRLQVARASFLDHDMTYLVEAPGLLAALNE